MSCTISLVVVFFWFGELVVDYTMAGFTHLRLVARNRRR